MHAGTMPWLAGADPSPIALDDGQVRGAARDAGPRRRRSWGRRHDARPVPDRRRAPHARSSWPRPAGPPRVLITITARSNERVSAAANVIRWINKGVSSRASKPSVSLSGEKGPAAVRAITFQLRALSTGPSIEVTVRFLEVELATGSAFRTRGRGHPPRDQLPHLSGLDLTTELLSQFVSPSFDHANNAEPP